MKGSNISTERLNSMIILSRDPLFWRMMAPEKVWSKHLKSTWKSSQKPSGQSWVLRDTPMWNLGRGYLFRTWGDLFIGLWGGYQSKICLKIPHNFIRLSPCNFYVCTCWRSCLWRVFNGNTLILLRLCWMVCCGLKLRKLWKRREICTLWRLQTVNKI